MFIADIVRALLNAGVCADKLPDIIEQIELYANEREGASMSGAAEKREKARIKKAAQRARKKEGQCPPNVPQSVPGDKGGQAKASRNVRVRARIDISPNIYKPSLPYGSLVKNDDEKTGCENGNKQTATENSGAEASSLSGQNPALSGQNPAWLGRDSGVSDKRDSAEQALPAGGKADSQMGKAPLGGGAAEPARGADGASHNAAALAAEGKAMSQSDRLIAAVAASKTPPKQRKAANTAEASQPAQPQGVGAAWQRTVAQHGGDVAMLPALADAEHGGEGTGADSPAFPKSAPVVSEKAKRVSSHPSPPKRASGGFYLNFGGSAAEGDSAPAEKTASKSAIAARGTRLPPDWVLGQASGEFALRSGFNRDEIRRMSESFADYWHGVAGAKGRKADWAATWRNWVRREADKRAQQATRGGYVPPGKYAHLGNGKARGIAEFLDDDDGAENVWATTFGAAAEQGQPETLEAAHCGLAGELPQYAKQHGR